MVQAALRVESDESHRLNVQSSAAQRLELTKLSPNRTAIRTHCESNSLQVKVEWNVEISLGLQTADAPLLVPRRLAIISRRHLVVIWVVVVIYHRAGIDDRAGKAGGAVIHLRVSFALEDVRVDVLKEMPAVLYGLCGMSVI